MYTTSFTEKDIPEYPYRNAQPKYQKIVGKSGTIWFVPDSGNSDLIHCSNSDKNGYGGSTIEFKMVDGSIEKIVGPWHSNPDGLFSDTGVDLRNNSWTFGCVSCYRENKGYCVDGISGIMTSIVYLDTEWTKGSFNRIEDLAKELAAKNHRDYYYYSASSGGASAGMIEWRRGAMRKMLDALKEAYANNTGGTKIESLVKEYDHHC